MPGEYMAKKHDVNIRVFSWDWDGVAVRDSEFLKEEAWHIVFAAYEGRYEPRLQEARNSFGYGKRGDRYDILRYVYEGLGESAEKIGVLIKEGAKVFDDHLQKGMLRLGLADGFIETLNALNAYPHYVNSGTAIDGLKRSVDNFGIKRYFKDVLGGPNTKLENLTTIAECEKVLRAHIIHIGDTYADVDGARAFGCRFIGVANEWNKWTAREKLFPLVTDLRDITKFV